MQRHKVVISPDAQRMIKEHIYFLAQVNVNAAKRLKKELMLSIRSLAQMPERYPRLDLEGSKYRRMLAAERYIILYQVAEDTVYVEYVADGRQDYRWMIE